jgi:hypothetical protein
VGCAWAGVDGARSAAGRWRWPVAEYEGAISVTVRGARDAMDGDVLPASVSSACRGAPGRPGVQACVPVPAGGACMAAWETCRMLLVVVVVAPHLAYLPSRLARPLASRPCAPRSLAPSRRARCVVWWRQPTWRHFSAAGTAARRVVARTSGCAAAAPDCAWLRCCTCACARMHAHGRHARDQQLRARPGACRLRCMRCMRWWWWWWWWWWWHHNAHAV